MEISKNFTDSMGVSNVVCCLTVVYYAACSPYLCVCVSSACIANYTHFDLVVHQFSRELSHLYFIHWTELGGWKMQKVPHASFLIFYSNQSAFRLFSLL